METLLILTLLAAFVIFLAKLVEDKQAIEHLAERAARSELCDAASTDNFNFISNCLARFAEATFGKTIPVYPDNEKWRPGDIVEFDTVIGNHHLKGEIEVHFNDEGMMEDRCPVCIHDYKNERYFEAGQVENVKLLERPEHFAKLMQKSKKI